MYEHFKAKAVSGLIPQGWTIVAEMAVNHPRNHTVGGALCKFEQTGSYAIISAGIIHSVPRTWAQAHDETLSVGEFADTLKSAMSAAGLTQKALSELVGIPAGTIRNWCQGIRTPAEYVQQSVLNSIKNI